MKVKEMTDTPLFRGLAFLAALLLILFAWNRGLRGLLE